MSVYSCNLRKPRLLREASLGCISKPGGFLEPQACWDGRYIYPDSILGATGLRTDVGFPFPKPLAVKVKET